MKYTQKRAGMMLKNINKLSADLAMQYLYTIYVCTSVTVHL